MLGVVLALLVACKAVPIDTQIHRANQSVTVVLTSTSSALNAHLISSKQAEAVSNVAHQVNPLLDSAKAASDANDPEQADKTLRLVNSLLAALGAYVPPTGSSP
jgi:endonuclease III